MRSQKLEYKSEKKKLEKNAKKLNESRNFWKNVLSFEVLVLNVYFCIQLFISSRTYLLCDIQHFEETRS